MGNTIKLPRGGAKTASFIWRDGAGLPINLTGYTVAAYEVKDAPQESVPVAVTNAATGAVQFKVIWDESMSDGRVVNFRIRAVPVAGDPLVLGPIYVEVT
jgi:hypothetical protein